MATLKNFTLEGEAIQLIGYKDQHGNDLYDPSLVERFDRRGLTREELQAFALAILNDVMWGGLLNTCAGDFTDETIKRFQEGEDGVQLQDLPEE